jgi:hypothetical protein
MIYRTEISISWRMSIYFNNLLCGKSNCEPQSNITSYLINYYQQDKTLKCSQESGKNTTLSKLLKGW